MNQNGINVLSLFDGISCGRVALERAGIKVNQYFASEIDKYAIQIANKNYPDTLQLGDVTKWKNWAIDYSKVDILFAGFPCQAWSISGNMKGIEDERGALVFTMLDIINTIKEQNPRVKILLENVGKMGAGQLDYLDELLNMKHTKINSCYFSAQSRDRVYWSNIDLDFELIDCGLTVNSILKREVATKYFMSSELHMNLSNSKARKNKPLRLGYFNSGGQGDRIYSVDHKSVTLSALGGGRGAKTGLYLVDGCIRKPTPIEAERLQTLPDDYTAGVTDSQRYKAIGNGWTVDVIAHILRGIK